MDTSPKQISLSDGWQLWPIFELRGAGFPIVQLLQIADLDLAAPTRALLSAEDAFQDTLDSLGRLLPRLHPTAKKAAFHLLKRLRQGHLAIDPHLSEALAAAFDAAILSEPSTSEETRHLASLWQDAWRGATAAAASHQRLQMAWREAWEAALHQQRIQLRKVAEDPRFRCAVLWQNRQAVHTGLDVLLRRPPDARDTKTRQKENLVASYLQRYAAKNDSIGFFGPIGWGRWDVGIDTLDVLPGPTLLASSLVAFEPWAIDSFAKVAQQDPELLWDLPPRLNPTLRLQSSRLYGAKGARSVDGALSLSPLDAELLGFCDGRCTPRQITRLLPDHPDVFSSLLFFFRKGWLLWEISIPFTSTPEDALRAAFSNAYDDESIARHSSALSALLAAKSAVVRAGENPTSLDHALAAVEDTFSIYTDQDPIRNAGQTYAGRTLLYTDCRRDLSLSLGQAIHSKLKEPLPLLLHASRWFSAALAEAYEAEFHSIFQHLKGFSLQEEIPLLTVWKAARELLVPLSPVPVIALAEQFSSLWSELFLSFLPADPNSWPRFLRIPSSSLRGPLHAAFPADRPGWPGARHHSPDILLASEGIDGFQRGDFFPVLGEVHTGLNTLCTLSATSQATDNDELQSLFLHDLPSPSIAPIPSDDFARSSHDNRLSPHDLHIDTGAPWASWRPSSSVLPVSSFVVASEKGRLYARTLDLRYRFSLLQIFERFLKLRAAIHASLRPSWDYTPRIAIDELVVIRESWKFAASDLPWATETSPDARFLGLQRWAKNADLPRFVFAKIPDEVKPVYLDLQSPVFIETFAGLIRRTEQGLITLTEMLPAPHQTWLPDAKGQTYVCEMRMIAVDPNPWKEEGTLA